MSDPKSLLEAFERQPGDPVERLFWFEWCLRMAASTYAADKTREKMKTLREAAIAYAEEALGIRAAVVACKDELPPAPAEQPGRDQPAVQPESAERDGGSRGA